MMNIINDASLRAANDMDSFSKNLEDKTEFYFYIRFFFYIHFSIVFHYYVPYPLWISCIF